MMFNAIQTVSAITVFLSVFMAFFFLQKKGDPRTGSILLSLLLIVFAVLVSCSLAISLGLARKSPYSDAMLLITQMSFLTGPLVYIYLLTVVDVNYAFKKDSWLHFVPFIIAVSYAAILVASPPERNIWTYPGRTLITAAVGMQILLYLIAGWKSVRENGLNLRLLLSYIDNSRLSLLRYFYVGLVVLWTAQLQLFVGWDILGHPQWCPYGVSLYIASAFLFLAGILFIALNRPDAFQRVQKYNSSQLKQSDKDMYKEKILSAVREDKLFLNPDILLSDIAEKVGIAPYYVSQVINESLQQNFRDFINKFRIEESKRLLTQPDQQLNVFGIALNVGFNSKSAFNNAFKRHTGVTPKEFRKNSSYSVSVN